MARIKKLREGTSELTDKQLLLIGRVATNFAMVEFMATAMAASLVTPIQPLGSIAISGLRFELLLAKLKKLAEVRIGNERLREGVVDWTERADAAKKARDRVLHTPWFVEPSLQSMLGVRMGRRTTPMVEHSRLTDQELAAIADSIQTTASEGFMLTGEVNGIPPLKEVQR